jgi:hypothetical protein
MPMLERPDLADETIGQCLHEHYGLVTQAITFLPIGYDATVWVFRVEAADHVSYFLKVKCVPVTAAFLAVPHFLRRQGVAEVVAPLPTRNQALSAPIDDRFTAILYPY